MKNIVNYVANIKTFLSPRKNRHASLAKNLHHLENRLRGAINFLKKTSIHVQGVKLKLNQLPWFLLIGSPGSGKTTMLANSGIKFILNKKINPQETLPSEHCDWWVTTNAVFVDVPGHYLIHNADQILSNKCWRPFLTLIKKLRGKRGLSGMVIALSLTELMDTGQRERLAENIRLKVHDVHHKFGYDLPIYFSITKCDLLPGFLEFFSDYGSDELTQAWGVTLPSLEAGDSLIETFINRFNALIKRLNEQLIWRLHQERNPYAKLHVKDFPLQVERFKEAFADLLKFLREDIASFALRGVYLTSATQQPAIEDVASPPQIVLASTFQQALSILQAPMMPGQAYFIKQFILQGLTQTETMISKTGRGGRKFFYVLVASMIVISAIFYGNLYLHSIQTTSTANSTFVENNRLKAMIFPIAAKQKKISGVS